jgi:hypothetical protein
MSVFPGNLTGPDAIAANHSQINDSTIQGESQQDSAIHSSRGDEPGGGSNIDLREGIDQTNFPFRTRDPI